MKSALSAFACASLVAIGLSTIGISAAAAQGWQGSGRDFDRNDDRDRGRRGGRDYDDDRNERRPGFRFEFGNRDRDRDCHWVVRRYRDEDGDMVERRRRVCD
jgi:hypothetical protein